MHDLKGHYVTQAPVTAFGAGIGVAQSTHVELSSGQAVPLHHRFSCFSSPSAANALVRRYVGQKDKLLMLCWCTSPASRHPPETRCLQSSDYSPPSSILLQRPASRLSGCSCLFWLPCGSLRLFRQDLNSSVKLQSSHHSVGCLERLTMTYQTLQTFNGFHQPSTAILHLWLCRFDQRLPLFS